MRHQWSRLVLMFVCVIASVTPIAASAADLSISGTIWVDKNADGIRQPEEDGSHQRLLLHGPSGATVELNTDLDGRYRFEALEPGDYTVGIFTSGPSWYAFMTHPQRRYLPPFTRHVSLTDHSVAGVDFGLHSPTGIPLFLGLAWIDATPVSTPDVRAYVNGVDCTGPATIVPPDLHEATYAFGVLSDELKPGCANPGDEIRFTIESRPANETAVWQPVPEGEAAFAGGRGSLRLTAGQPFFSLTVQLQRIAASGEPEPVFVGEVSAFIAGHDCGIATPGPFGAVLLSVPSREQEPGCGEEGAVISFEVDGAPVPETAIWQPGHGGELTLTIRNNSGPALGPTPDMAGASVADSAQVTPPNAGSAGLKR